ncbi:MAG: M55 family metallopeptidase [Deltaproteobacteria bacterium]|nr:M55 family metallopeptidase [Deltaproteobacteria bacterium]
MKVFVCADMEGATGIVHREQLLPEGGAAYAAGCRLLTGDVVAVVEGAVAAGATEVVISEGHAGMRNILIDELPAEARLVCGPALWTQKPLCQIAGLDDTFGVALFVGFHSRAGTPRGLLSHTWAGAIVHELTVQGRTFGETAINAAICGAFGVPVGMVAGADDVIAEAREDLPAIELVTTKRALGFNLAECWGPKATRPQLRDAARRAVERTRAGELLPFLVEGPVVAELETHRREMADRMMVAAPDLERIGERRVRATAGDAREALSRLWRGIAEAFHEPAAWLR